MKKFKFLKNKPLDIIEHCAHKAIEFIHNFVNSTHGAVYTNNNETYLITESYYTTTGNLERCVVIVYPDVNVNYSVVFDISIDQPTGYIYITNYRLRNETIHIPIR